MEDTPREPPKPVSGGKTSQQVKRAAPNPSPPLKHARYPRRPIRQATFIMPNTGERLKRSFSLRLLGSSSSERSPLLSSSQPSLRFYRPRSSNSRHRRMPSASMASYSTTEVFEAIQETVLDGFTLLLKHACSSHGIAVLKCSIAYVLGSLATLIPAYGNALLGTGLGKHMVATVVVYFHPARSAGSMMEAFLLAAAAFLYALFISLTSMAVTVFFRTQDMTWLGHVVVLIVFCGGGLGLVGWTKQRLSNPLVNVACSLASLAIIIVLTKEDAIKLATFSYTKVLQVLKIILLGIFTTSLVSFTIKPSSARRALKADLAKVNNHFETVLAVITQGFLSGSIDTEGFTPKIMQDAPKQYCAIFTSLVINLREAKLEHLALGTEVIYEFEKKLVKCIEQIAQDLEGLRSAAATQFALLKGPRGDGIGIQGTSDGYETQMLTGSFGDARNVDYVMSPTSILSPTLMPTVPQDLSLSPDNSRRHTVHFQPNLGTIEEQLERPLSASQDTDRMPSFSSLNPVAVSDVYSLFIAQFGPSIKSFAFTIRGVFHELQFGPAPDYEVALSSTLVESLNEAKLMFIGARKRALEEIYKLRTSMAEQSTEVVANYEEVAASCAYFSSSLEDLAEDTIKFLGILQQLVPEYSHPTRSWSWLRIWQYLPGAKGPSYSQPLRSALDEEAPLVSGSDSTRVVSHPMATKSGNVRSDPPPRRYTRHALSKVIRSRHNQTFRYRVYRATSSLRREDVKFAFKVGIGAVLYALWSFVPSTRPIYAHWRGEWGLLSYMLVCSMTIGASSTTGFNRFGGTCAGAVLAVAAWSISWGGNAIVLGIAGWLVSIGCFIIIVVRGQGPMGRFILLTYNLSALYAYALTMQDNNDNDGSDENDGENTPEIYSIALHRVVAVASGCLWGIIITRLVWPISAQRKLKNGLSLLWLRMALIWKRDPLQMILDNRRYSYGDDVYVDEASSVLSQPGAQYRLPQQKIAYIDIREETELRQFLRELEAIRSSAKYEFDLRGTFEEAEFTSMLESTGRMLGAFHAMQAVLERDLKSSKGEVLLLRHTRAERDRLSQRICHLLSVLASSMKLEYPIVDALPSIAEAREKFLAKLYEYRRLPIDQQEAVDEDFELLYAYGLATGQIEKEVAEMFRCIEKLYGLLDEESLQLT